ncbi:MAG: HpcH/HpaI aldolase family protein [Alphaproteobacteria bacterium]
MDLLAQHKALKDRIRAGDAVFGTFVKTPAVQTVEIVAASGVDFIALDAEHAPFDLAALDRCILAARDLPVLVRVPDAKSEMVLQVLDLGAAGIIVPHICSPEDAKQAVGATRYRDGTRGFSPSGRSGGYGAMSMADYRTASDDSVIVIGQIEDAEAIDRINDIAAVEALDALLIGRADLAVSLGVDTIGDSAVADAVDMVCTAAQRAGRPNGIFLPNTQGVECFREKGVALFIIGTDQSLLKNAIGAITAQARADLGNR